MSFDYAEIEDFLKLDLPDTPERIDTFLDIAGFPHYENVISNIYAYYFDRNNSHTLKELFLTSFIEAIRKKSIALPKDDPFKNRLEYLDNWAEWSVKREESIDRKRIDIFLEETSGEDSTYIIIENKVYAGLYNPLDTYWNIDKKTDRKLGVVMSLYSEKVDHKGFINLLHKEFLHEVKNQLGQYIETANDRDISIIKDTIINLKQLENMTDDTKEMLEFYQLHKEKIENIFDLRNDVCSNLLNEVSRLGEEKLKAKISFPRATYYRSIIDNDNEEIYITFYFNDEGCSEQSAFAISIELFKGLAQKGTEIASNSKLFDKHLKNGIKKEALQSSGDWFILASKYYQFDDIDFDFSKLIEIYNNDWKPFLDDLKKLI
ncbi:MAG: PD-(D/E)XK nuclease family protein [Reichenbachiella sp.]